MISLLAWELYQVLRSGAQPPSGSWPLAPVDVVFLVLLPALATFAFTRLFLVVSQTARGTLHVYSAISSPLAWVFWLGLGISMIGQGLHVAGKALYQAMPEVLAQGEFASKISFLNSTLGYPVLGTGLLLVSLALLMVGHGAGQEITGPERVLFVLGSLATYGFTILYVGVEGRQIILAIVASVLLSGVSLWNLSPSAVTRDPIGAFVVPGSFLAGVTLIIWVLVVGGQPTWP